MDTSKKLVLIFGCLSFLTVFLGHSLGHPHSAQSAMACYTLADVPFTSQDEGSPERTVSGTSDPGLIMHLS